MSIQLTGADVIDLAVQTELRGERFYREAIRKADSAEAKDLFTYLADEEVRHKQVFEGLGGQIVLTQTDVTSWEEAMGYIQAIVDREFFDKDAPIRAIPVAQNVPDMVRQAIDFEKQTLLFFYGLRDLVQPANRPLIDQIMEEEKSHVRRLSAMLRTADQG
ncbi:MAG: hypothetical protein FJZ90_09175 [Chloroflexi bacterium]|nr:hypothetical protein [Chloroflexota bacterium]